MAVISKDHLLLLQLCFAVSEKQTKVAFRSHEREGQGSSGAGVTFKLPTNVNSPKINNLFIN